MPKAKIFEDTLKDYLAQVRGSDYRSKAERLGAGVRGRALVIPFYGSDYHLSDAGVTDAAGRPANFAVSVVLCRYVLQCPKTAPQPGDWVTYREFKDAGPLVGYFTTNTHKLIESAFTDDPRALEAACRRLGGRPGKAPGAYDCSVVFDLLPRIPVFLRFNARDEEFPAQASILFRRSAEAYLDMECLAIGGTYLAGLLIGAEPGRRPDA